METFTSSMAKVASKQRFHFGRISTLVLLLTCASTCAAFSQQNPLTRRISIDLDHKRLDDALDRVGKKGQFTYSYRSDLLRSDSLVSIHASGMQVRDITEHLLGPGYHCKTVGNHVVIRRVAEPPVAEAPLLRHLEGFLSDANTGEKIRFATVYENASRQNALSDAQGHYAFDLPGDLAQAELNISRRGYFDTLIVINPSRVRQLTVGLRPYPYANQPLASREPDLGADLPMEPLPLADWLVGQDQMQLTENVEGPLHKFPFQISLLPRIGTNRLLSGAMENNFSLNILAGYANGVNGIEVGGLVNLDRENVRGLQVGGLVNAVGGNVSGLQVGGIMNHVHGSVHGFQVGGIMNHVGGSVNGFQVAGIMNNVMGTFKGFQVAGIVNLNHQPVDGMQVAGIANYSPGDVGQVQIGGLVNEAVGNVGGFQIAGIYNHAGGQVDGFQIGGILNRADSSVQGFQLGGIANIAHGNVGRFQMAGISNLTTDTVSGFQVSGIVNKARVVNGFQIGLVNIADSVGGFCIGLFNLIKHGYNVIELGTNDVSQAQVNYKAGRRQFYNILCVGYRFGPTHFALSYGAGFGTTQLLGPLTISLEATVNDVIEQGLGPGRMNMLLPQRLSIGLPIGQHFEIFAGVAHNLHITTPHNSAGEFKSALGQHALWRYDGANTRVQGWLGYQGGLRIIL